MAKSNIEWTQWTSNPIGVKGSRTNYCVKVSPGCKHCYAEGMAKRLAAISGDRSWSPYKAMPNPPEMELRTHVLDQWCAMKKPKKIFVGSMTDIFGEWVADNWLFQIFDTMEHCKHLTFQILTKRADRMCDFIDAYCKEKKIGKLPRHIWCGISTENHEWLEKRVVYLLKTKCSVRFLSCEPLIGPIDLLNIKGNAGSLYQILSPITGCVDSNRAAIDWVIAGGESGRDARPVHPGWIVSLRNQCADAGVAFFFKQWGEWAPEMQQPDSVVNDKIKRRIVITTGESGAADSTELTDKLGNTWQNQSPRIMQRVGKHEARNFIMGEQYLEFPNQ